MKHKTSLLLLAAAVAVCAVYGGYRLLSNSTVQSTDNAYIRADSVFVAPRISGQVNKVLVDDNQSVKSGQLLVEIDDRNFAVAQAAAVAGVRAAEGEVRNLAAGIERQAAVIDQAAATTRSTAASLRFAQANAQRYLNLSTSGAGTQQERQRAESELQSVQAARDRDEAARIASVKTLDVLKAQLEVAKAVLAKNEAAVRQADLDLSYTKVTAPQDGIVGQRSVRVGAYISQGRPVMAVVPVDEAFVVANFRETQLAHLQVGQRVDIRVDSFSDHSFEGRIQSLAPASGASFAEIVPDNATGNFTKVSQRLPVKIVFEPDQPDLQRLRVGMSVVVKIDTAQELDR
jgi:membrane fusion protein (multidrug efflux system)